MRSGKNLDCINSSEARMPLDIVSVGVKEPGLFTPHLPMWAAPGWAGTLARYSLQPEAILPIAGSSLKSHLGGSSVLVII